jgi:phosphoribosylglycinamide formyltransferase-1
MAAGEFISERLQPTGDDFALPAAIGEPALPLRFTWRRRTLEVAAVLNRRKEYQADRTHGSGERYLRRHWFDLRMSDGAHWSVYFERQPGAGRAAKSRWWLYATAPAGDPPAAPAS